MNERTEKKGSKAIIPPALVAEARGGDQAAFAELYERTNAALYRSIRSMVRDEDLAWDILQETYLRAYQGLDKLETDGAFLPWLRRIAVNETARQMAKRLPVNFSELGGEDGEDWEPEIPDLRIDSQPEPALDRKETARLVREILAELPEGQQMILGMRYYEDMSVKEIAGTLHIAPGSVRAQLFQGRKKVEARVRALEKQGVRLYGLGPIPFLVALLRNLAPAEEAEQRALATVLSKAAGGAAEAAASGAAGTAAGSAASTAAGSAASTAAGSAAAAATGETAVNMTVMTAGQAFLHGLGVKLLAGVFAVALVGGGLWAGNRLLKEHRPAPEEPSVVSTEAPAVPTQPTGPEDETAPPRRELVGNECGAEGDNLTWRFDEETGTLIIEGSGAMADFSYEYGNLPPWSEQVDAYCGDTGNSIIISLPDGLSHIGAYAFYDYNTESLVIPRSVTSIGEYAFLRCQGLSSLTLPDGLNSIGYGAFSGCSELRSLTLPDSLTSIRGSAFYDCSGLRSLVLPDGLTSIGYGAFSGCTGLRSLTLPDSLTSIGDLAFSLCTGLSSLTLPDGLTSIGYSAFEGCTGLRSLTLPDSLTSIGDLAFSRCTGLSSLTLPDGLTSIGDLAFSRCTGLRSLTIPAGVSSFGEDIFDGCPDLTLSVYAGSAAEAYAEEHGIPFVVIEP